MIKIKTIQITPDLQALLTEIDEFKGAWPSFEFLEPEALSVLRYVATIQSVGALTRLEGCRVTDRDVGVFLANLEAKTCNEQEIPSCANVMESIQAVLQETPCNENHTTSSTCSAGTTVTNREVDWLLENIDFKTFECQDESVIAGYASVMEFVFEMWQDININENNIKQLHRDLLRCNQKDDGHCGTYKKTSNSFVAFDGEGKKISVAFETATPFDTPQLMAELVAWLHEAREQRQLHPLIIVAMFIFVFLEIHPFQSGNRSLVRVLTPLLLMQSGYTYVRYSSIGSVVEESQEAGYLAISQTQASLRTEAPNWQPWLMFFLGALQQQTRRLALRVEQERRVSADFARVGS
jgi:hypothetical protein